MPERASSPRRIVVVVVLVLVVGGALAFGGYHALRALDMADATATMQQPAPSQTAVGAG